MMTDFMIKEADALKLVVFAEAFHRLYLDKGLEEAMDRNDVQSVMNLAVDALGPPAREFVRLIGLTNLETPSVPDVFSLSCEEGASPEIKSAVALVYCFRHLGKIDQLELDDAYSALASSDIEHSPSP
jgi:hypothetical protein